jgi:hypothetical protein
VVAVGADGRGGESASSVAAAPGSLAAGVVGPLDEEGTALITVVSTGDVPLRTACRVTRIAPAADEKGCATVRAPWAAAWLAGLLLLARRR